jgi:hypothetical protein
MEPIETEERRKFRRDSSRLAQAKVELRSTPTHRATMTISSSH